MPLAVWQMERTQPGPCSSGGRCKTCAVGLHGFQLASRHCSKTLSWSAGILQEAMGRGEYWRLIDSQGRPPGLLGMWPSRAVSFIENHDTGARLLTLSAAAVLCSMARFRTARPCPPSSPTEACCLWLHCMLMLPHLKQFSSVICIDSGPPSEPMLRQGIWLQGQH